MYFAYAKAMVTRHPRHIFGLSDHVYLCTLEGKLKLELHPQGLRKPQRIIYETLGFMKLWTWGIEQRKLAFGTFLQALEEMKEHYPTRFCKKAISSGANPLVSIKKGFSSGVC